jgi:hypothetical protein
MTQALDQSIAAMDLFLWQHAHVHSAAVAQLDGVPGAEDLAVRGLSDDQVRQRPRADLNSIAWLLWHMARCEDVAINAVLAGRRQVLDEEDWRARLGVARGDIGTGMGGAAVDDFCTRIDVPALRAYRAAVGRRTREVVPALPEMLLREPVPQARLATAFDAGAIAEEGAWVKRFWQDKPGIFFLWLATGHNYLHLGEAYVARSQAGVGLGL